MGVSGDKRDDASGGVSPPPSRDDRSLVPGWLALYFSALITLTFVAAIPGTITIGFLIFFIPGFALLASPTLLYYSIAVLPSYFVYRLHWGPLLTSLVATVSVISAALLPHYASQLESLLATKTQPAILDPTQPFYFGYVHCKNSDINVCLAIARD